MKHHSKEEDTYTLLAVEEDEEMRKALSIALGGKHRLVLCSNAVEASRLAALHLPDLIVLDLSLQKRDCIEAIKKFRLMEEWIGQTKFLVLIYSSEDDNVLDGLIRGKPEYFLLRPDDGPEVLAGKVLEMLSKRI